MIDVGPRKRRRWKIWIVVAAVLLLFSFSRIVSIYISALWFESLGYSSVYWYIFKVKLALFFGSAILTALFVERDVSALPATLRSLCIREAHHHSQQPTVSVFTGEIHSDHSVGSSQHCSDLIFGFRLKEHWRQFALYWNQPATNIYDPIFGKSLGFYLFSLPLYDLLSSWLFGVTFIILCAAVAYSLLGPAANGAEAERALVVGSCVPRCLLRARTVSCWC